MQATRCGVQPVANLLLPPSRPQAPAHPAARRPPQAALSRRQALLGAVLAAAALQQLPAARAEGGAPTAAVAGPPGAAFQVRACDRTALQVYACMHAASV